MDPTIATIVGLAAIAFAAIGTAYYYAKKATELEEVCAAAYQVAGVIADDGHDLPKSEQETAAELMLNVLADPFGHDARVLLESPAETSYEAILQLADK